MIAGLAWMLVANAACLLGAYALASRLSTGQRSADLALFLLLRFSLASAAVLATGLLGILTARTLGLLGAAALAGLLLGGAHRTIPWAALRGLRRDYPALLLATAGLVLARFVAQAWFLAPHDGDATCYHLPKVAEWVQAGAITRETGVDYRSPFPGGFELFEIWWTVFLHHDVLVEAAGIELWILALAAVHALGRWTGLSRGMALAAGLLFCTTPIVLMQAVSCLNDLPVVAILLTSAALIAARVQPFVLLLPLGVGIGVKPTFGFALPGLALLAFLVRKDPPASRPGRAAAAGGALLGAFLGTYWYLRNLVLYGNPIYPGGARGFVLNDEFLVQQVGPNLVSLRENLRRLVDSRLYDHLLGYNPTSEYIAGWGPAVFGCGLLALLVALREPGRLRLLAAALAVSLVSVLTLVLSDRWFVRFVLFVPALACLALPPLAVRIRGLPLLLGILVAIQFATTVFLSRNAVGEYPALARQPWRKRAADMIAGLPKDAEPVACLQGGGLFNYLLYGPDFSRRVIYIRAGKPEEIVAEMRRLEVKRIYGSRDATSVLEEMVKARLLKPEIGRFYSLP